MLETLSHVSDITNWNLELKMSNKVSAIRLLDMGAALRLSEKFPVLPPPPSRDQYGLQGWLVCTGASFRSP
jgi:hypothetical protein